MRTFLAAIRQDGAAQMGIAHTKSALDLDVGGNVLIGDVQDAREIGIRSRSEGDFTFRLRHLALPGQRAWRSSEALACPPEQLQHAAY